jgi:hypothetical protein
MNPSWAPLLVAFVGGSLATAVITAFVKNCIFHPVISVCLEREQGSYGRMTMVERSTGKALYEARYLRLHVENTGLSSIKACSGYITGIRTQAAGKELIPEVIALGWANHGMGARDIPRGAFFHLDIASLHLLPDRRALQVAHEMPTSLAHLFASDNATYELQILVAADNAPPRRRIRVRFTYDANSDDLAFEPVNETRFPWWAFWKRLRRVSAHAKASSW